MPHKVTVEAKEVAQAIEKGLKKMGLRRDQVEVKILENPRKGFLGIGARNAVVELRQKRWVSDNLDAQIYMDVPKKKRSNSRGRGGRSSSRSRKNDDFGVREIKRGGRRAYGARHSGADKAPKANEAQLLPSPEIQNAVIPDYLKAPLQEAKTYLANVLEHMGVKVENLNAWWDEKQHRILLTFDCDHPAIVIGKEGKTLESLQYLATLSISRHFDKPISVIADTQNYWRKAEDKINADLEYGINQIKNGYSVYRFRPMSAQLRRYIHRAAENNEFVITVSEGEGQWRKVTLRPRPADQPVQKAEPAAVQPAAANAAVASEAASAAQADQTAQPGCACEQAAPCVCQTAPAAENQPQTAPAANVQTPSAETVNTQEQAQPACACQSVTEPAPAQPACACQAAEDQTPAQAACTCGQTAQAEQTAQDNCSCSQSAPCACQTAPAAENQPAAPAVTTAAPEAVTAQAPAAEPAAQPVQPQPNTCGPLFDTPQHEEQK